MPSGGRVALLLLASGCAAGGRSECAIAPVSSQVLVAPPPSLCQGTKWDVNAEFEPPEPWTLIECPLSTGLVFERRGGRKLETDELGEFHRRHSGELMEQSGIVSAGIGVCCRSPGAKERRLCLLGTILNCGATRSELLERVSEMLASDGLGDASLVYALDAHAVLDGPRCQGAEAACEPERAPYSTQAYDPSAGRCVRTDLPVWPTTCKNDGECVVGGCGGCIPWMEWQPMAECEEQIDERAGEFPFCGRVAERCAWFKQ